MFHVKPKHYTVRKHCDKVGTKTERGETEREGTCNHYNTITRLTQTLQAQQTVVRKTKSVEKGGLLT